MHICPTCKRKMPVPKDNRRNKLIADQERAQAAITQLEIALEFPETWRFTTADHAVNPSFNEALQLEIDRLRLAVTKPRMLWNIYRRADKGPAYA